MQSGHAALKAPHSAAASAGRSRYGLTAGSRKFGSFHGATSRTEGYVAAKARSAAV